MRLKKHRIEAGLSQNELAKITGVNVRTIQCYEQGVKLLDHARIDTILKICIALDCHLIELLDNEDYRELLKRAKIK